MRKYDITLFLSVILLMLISIVMVYSSTAVFYAQSTAGNLPGQSFTNVNSSQFIKQIIFVVLSVFALFATMRMRLDRIRNYSRFVWLGAVILLLLLPFLGNTVNNATRWYNLGLIKFNPAEMARIAVIVFAADIMARKREYISDFARFTGPVFVILAGVALGTILQRDMSSTVILSATVVAMIGISGISIKHMSYIFASGLAAATVLVLQESYRLERLMAFFSPGEASDQLLHQARQSLIGIGNGGFSGVGPGNSFQKFFFLPEAHTDYIMAIIGEEFGFIGAALIIALFFTLMWRGIKIARNAKDPFHAFLAFGITINFLFYAVFHMAMVSGMLPVTGMGLPFVSYGGSAMLANAVLAGVLMAVGREVHAPPRINVDGDLVWGESL
jgi:cell division protein FtsW